MYHAKSIEETLKEFETNENGLSENEAEKRLKKFGMNVFEYYKRRTLIDIVIEQFKNWLLLLLIIAAFLAYAIGHVKDSIGILAVVIINIIFGVILEYNADKSMEKLKKLMETKAFVIRNGKKYEIEARYLVPGDIVIVEEGKKVPADIRIIDEFGIEVNEAPLTGESLPVRKSTEKNSLETPLAERTSMLFAGTFVTKGSAKGVVVATGKNTEFGKIGETLSKIEEEETTLEKILQELSRIISLGALIIVSILFFLGLIIGKSRVEELLIYSIAVIVAAVPEGMLTILTLMLAIGTTHMAKENALVRDLHAVETLGNVTYIATDKTGTITEGKMAVVKIYDGKIKDFAEIMGTEKIMSYSYLCNGAHLTDSGVLGDETDRAFLLAGIIKGVDVRKFKKIVEIIEFVPFDPTAKVMKGLYRIEGERIAIVKGAPEKILEISEDFENHGKIDDEKRKEIEKILNFFTSNGMRVIGIAYKKVNSDEIPSKNFTFLGFIALHDQVRKEVKKTIEICKEAGIEIIMMTGDNKNTAKYIAEQIGLDSKKEIVNWNEIENLPDKDFEERIKNISVVSRATPSSKLRIVEALVKNNEIIAVTGDGVNDALALKKAHVGVVMGKTGTDISREVADVVLLDDNFATLEKAIEYGRKITYNIISFLRFQLTTNVSLVILSIPYIIGAELLKPLQILWINLIIDGPPALSLAFEKPGKDIMKVKAVKKREWLGLKFVFNIINMALYMVGISLVIYTYYTNVAPEKAATMVFAAFSLMQIFNVLNVRSERSSFYEGLSENRFMIIVLILTTLVQIAIIQIEALGEFFGTVKLNMSDWIIAFVAGASVLIVGEATKLGARRK